MALALTIETEREVDGRWIAEVMEIPGAMAYGETREGAVAKARALALRVIADRIERGEDESGLVKSGATAPSRYTTERQSDML